MSWFKSSWETLYEKPNKKRGQLEDAPVYCEPKKLKTCETNRFQIRGMPSALRSKMAHLIQSQKQRKPVSNQMLFSNSSNLSATEERPGDVQGLARPPIHHLADISCQSTNGSSDLLGLEVEREITDGISRTKLTNGQSGPHQEHPVYPQAAPRSVRPVLSSLRSDRPDFPRCVNSSRSEQYLPLYDKTFNLSRNSSLLENSCRAYSVAQKKQLQEKEMYKQLLRQFSGTDVGRVLPRSVSTPLPGHQTSLLRDRTSWLPRSQVSRDVPVITLDSTLGENSILNKSTRRQSELFKTPKTTQPEKPSFKDSPYFIEDWAKDLKEKFSQTATARAKKIATEKQRIGDLEEKRLERERQRQLQIEQRLFAARRERAVYEEDVYEEEVEEDDQYPELTSAMVDEIESALVPNPGDEILTEHFKIQIKRRDMCTLAGLNWLNDEIINFYMSLLMERGGNNDYGKVYAFNTFFYPKLLSSGYTSIRRWTRRTNIFDNDYLLVPIHLGMHWCLATVDFKKKAVNYYDSMGGRNPQCLDAIRQYLCDESLDKRKTEFDLTGWSYKEVKGIPEQLNGSDCGMFACKYAEYITRGAEITFTQEHMPYFRKRMVYEILKNKLL